MIGRGRYRAVALILAVLFSTSILGTTGLYEDQDGKYNWYEKHIGQYSQIIACKEHGIEDVASGGFLVSTEDGVVARLSDRDGSVVWRIVLGDGEHILPGTLSCGIDYASFASLSDDKKMGTVRVLRSSSGRHAWEDIVDLSDVAVLSAYTTERGILIASSGILTYRSLDEGRILWSKTNLVKGSDVHVKSMGGTVLVSIKTTQGISLLQLQESDGSVAKQEHIKYTKSGAYIGLVYSGLVELSPDAKQVCFLLLDTGSRCIQVVSDGDEDVVQHSKVIGRETLVASTSKKTVIIRIDSASKVPIIESTFDGVHGVISHDINDAIVIASLDASKPGIYLVQGIHTSVKMPSIKKYPVAVPTYLNGEESNLPSSIALGGVTNVLVQFTEGTTISFKNDMSTANWVRHESLAHITECMFSELPPSNPENEEEWQKKQPPLSQKLFVQLLILKTQLGMGRPVDSKIIEEHKSRTRDILRPTRDVDGFRKQIIVATKSGKVASLHSGNGAILWQVNFPGTCTEMHVRHWFTSEKDNILSVFATCSNKLSVYLLDGFTGRVLNEHIHVPYSHGINVLPLDPIITNKGEQNSFVILDGSDSVLKVLPFDDQSALSNFGRVSTHLVRWAVSKDGKSIYGVKLNEPGSAPSLHWKVNIVPHDSKMKILDISYRDKSEAIYSAAKPVFGGGVLLKNVNPNTLLAVAGGDEDTKTLVVTALDAVTGRVMYRQEHMGGTGPVKSIVSEHWAAYTFWQQTQGRWYIGVIDTYYPQPADLNAMNLLFSRGNANDTVSPYDAPPELIVESESFRTKYAASCLAVTKTSHGTTSKMLLMGTTNGQIVSIDRRMLDPRRPKVLPGTKPTPEQVYERLPPYHPEIGTSGPSFVTLYNRVERLQGIETLHAMLESSTLVFAHGLDMYFMRMQPSRGFDMVPDDFPHALLVFMVLGLAISLYILRKIIQKRTLRLTWK